jgi:hypothetical protein
MPLLTTKDCNATCSILDTGSWFMICLGMLFETRMGGYFSFGS